MKKTRYKYKIINQPLETEDELVHRQKMKEMIIKLGILLGQPDAKNDEDYFNYLVDMMDVLCKKYDIERTMSKINEFGTKRPRAKRGPLSEETKRKIGETLRQYQKELKGEVISDENIPGTEEFIKKDFEVWKENKSEFLKGLGGLR